MGVAGWSARTQPTAAGVSPALVPASSRAHAPSACAVGGITGTGSASGSAG
ncbi:hypothetical protein VSR01_26980 [Actinacidiphila sp. DG2A-62]|nr:hypothetical protein [Actinacidiphila sp. DG2A-62]MEC3996958.1 hypothetical protein [Actinacidiphila sp. DG2A-62]